MLKSNNPTALKSQRWIIESLLRMMEEKPYDEISVSEICHKADLDRRTFYRNFDSKNDVLEQYVIFLGNEYIRALTNFNTIDGYVATKLFFDFWKQHFRFILQLRSSGLADFAFKRFEAFVTQYRALLAGSNMPGVPDKQLKYIFAYRIGGLWNAMLLWAENGAVVSPDEMANTFMTELS